IEPPWDGWSGGLAPERRDAPAVDLAARGLGGEVEDPAALRLVVGRELDARVRADEGAHVAHERRVVAALHAPLGQGERLVMLAREGVQDLVLGARVLAVGAVQVVADDVEVMVSRIEAVEGVPARLWLAAPERVPDHAQLRLRDRP